MIDHSFILCLLHRAGIPQHEHALLHSEFVTYLMCGFTVDELAIAMPMGPYSTQIVPKLVMEKSEESK